MGTHDWGVSIRCARCGQWKKREEYGSNDDGSPRAFCLFCVKRMEEKGEAGEKYTVGPDRSSGSWIDRLRGRREAGVNVPVSKVPRADQLPMSTMSIEAGGRQVVVSYGPSGYEAKCGHRGTEVHGSGRTDSPAGKLIGSSYRGGLVLPSGGITVILTPEALADVQFIAGKGKPWATADGLEFPVVDKPKSDIVFWPWPDYKIPTDSPVCGDTLTIVKRITALHLQHKSGRTIEVACFGGHGRTGMLLAILLSLHRGSDSKEAVRLLREAYCMKAVETHRQEEFVRRAVDAVRFMMATQAGKGEGMVSSFPDASALSVPEEEAEIIDDAIASGEEIPVGSEMAESISERMNGQAERTAATPRMGDLARLVEEIGRSPADKARRNWLIREFYMANPDYTQAQIAKAVGLSGQRVSEIINGRS